MEKLEDRSMLAALPLLHPEYRIPDFVSQPTITSIASGDWDDPAIWSKGRVPNLTDLVAVRSGDIVSLDTDGVDVKAVGVHGVLDVSASIRVKDFVVYADGTLNMHDGTDVVFADGAIDLDEDPLQWGSGLIVLGTWTATGHEKPAYVRASGDILAGDSSIAIASVPTDWAPGDLLVLPGTEQNVADDSTQYSELVTLSGISNSTLTISSGAEFDHRGISPNPFDISRFAHIGNLTRSVILRSENPNGVRGHVAVTEDALVNIQNTAFVSLGRTTAEQPASNGGENQIGRYPFHAHHMHHAFSLTGSVVQDGRKWGIAVHDTNDSLIQNNIVFDTDGGGIVGEDGDELNNQFIGNLVIAVRGGFQNRLEGGRIDAADGSGFWFRASGNHMLNNTVYDAAGFAFNINGYQRGQKEGKIAPARAPGIFKDNEAVSSAGGIWVNWSQQFGTVSRFQRQVFEDTLIWHVSNRGVRTYHDANMTFQGITVISNPAVAAANEGSQTSILARAMIAFDFSAPNYQNHNIHLIDIKASGANAGITVPVKAGSEGAKLDGAILENYVNIAFANGAEPANLSTANVTYLPSRVPAISPSWPIVPANIWSQVDGVLEQGVMAPDAYGGGLAISLLSGGRLKLKGSSGDDVVMVSVAADKVNVELNSRVVVFPLSKVHSIEFTGGSGDDVFTNRSKVPSHLVGGSGNDVLTGGDGADLLLGGDGDDLLIGGDGDDVLSGEFGDDRLDGGNGDDKLRGHDGTDRLVGGNGDDLLNGGDANDQIDGGAGNDNIICGSGNDIAIGGQGNDYLTGNGGSDTLFGESGADFLSGGSENDVLVSGGGIDIYRPDLGADRLAPAKVDIVLQSDSNDVIKPVVNAAAELAYFGERWMADLLKKHFGMTNAEATDRILASIR